jgi:hypothetical protein
VARIGDVLVLPEADRQALREELRHKAIALDTALGRKASFDEVAEALRLGFAQALNLTLQGGELSSDEHTAMGLLGEKHQKREWLLYKATRTVHVND